MEFNFIAFNTPMQLTFKRSYSSLLEKQALLPCAFHPFSSFWNVEKNKGKLEQPKGSNSGGSNFSSMY